MRDQDARTDSPRQAGLRHLVEHFPRVQLTARTAFGPHGTVYEDAEDFAAAVDGQTWATLDTQFLARHHAVVHFVTDAVLAHYLPAWLAAVLDGEDETGHIQRSVVTTLTVADAAVRPLRSSQRFADWTDHQRRTVAGILLWLEGETRRQHARPDWRWVDAVDNPVTPALDTYWRQFLGPDQP